MEVDTGHFNDWANDAFVALNDNLHASSEKWQAYGTSSSSAFPQQAFTIPPALLTHGSVERYGQVTPPEELSPAEPPLEPVRESSIPLEQLKNESLFPDHQVQALQDYQPHHDQQALSDLAQEPPRKRRRTARQSSSQSQSTAEEHSHEEAAHPPASASASASASAPKRKRGRPKSTPQLVDALTADGFPVQVSSTRQSHLEKNRVAAHKCRQRKKEYISGLEGRAREFSARNKALRESVAMLREEVLELKNEVLRHANCGFWAVDEYLARCAGDLLGVEAPPTQAAGGARPKLAHASTSSSSTPRLKTDQDASAVSPLLTDEASPLDVDVDDEYAGLDLLNDFDDLEDEHKA